MACLVKGGKLSKCSKTNYYKCPLVSNIVQTCSLIKLSIYNGMYSIQCVVMILLSEQVRLIEL